MVSTEKRLYLASRSPRRAQLLNQIGLGFELLSVEIDETPVKGEKGADYVERLAISKARRGWSLLEGSRATLPVLGADTSVIVDDSIVGKPCTRDEGIAMLRSLSGRTHQVMTGVCLVYKDLLYSTVTVTDVVFRHVSDDEIANYWGSGEPQDKAGGYAIQGRGAIFVEQIHGSYSGVVGLPLSQTYQLLTRIEHEARL